MPDWLVVAVLASGALLVWALALYVLSRAPQRRASGWAALAMACLAVYLLGEALSALGPDLPAWSAWQRRTAWAPAVAAPAWLVLSLVLLVDEGPALAARRGGRLLLPVEVIGVGLGAIFGVISLTTTLVQDWNDPYVTDVFLSARHHPAGPLLLVFQLFILLCVVWSAVNLIGLWRASPPGSPLRSRFAWLGASALLLVVGAGWVVIASGVYGLAGLPGQALVVVAMVILGWTMARYGALLADESVGRDMLGFGAAMLAIVAIYGSITLLLAPDYAWLERALPLLLLIMATHVVVDTRGHLLDRVLFAPVLGTLRGQLRELSNRVVRQPDEIAALADVRETVDQILRQREAVELRVLVEGALRHLNDMPTLAQHGLLDELRVPVAPPLERAATLRAQLDQAIERLRPHGSRPTPGSTLIGGWLHYLVLKEAYAEGRLNKQIMQRYALSEGTFHRARRRAIDALTSDLAARSQTPAAAESTSSTSGATRSTV